MKSKIINPLISIIMPVYNTPATLLENSVNSVINQTYKNFELIIVDDGSNIECANKCDELAENNDSIILFHTSNRGVSCARNTGLQSLHGDYLIFIDSDDELVPNALEKMCTYINNYSFDFCVYGWYDYVKDGCFDHHPSEIPESISVNTFQCGIAEDNFIYGGGYPWNKLWNIDSVKKAHNGSLPLFDPSIDRYEDKLWALVASTNLESVLLIPDLLYKYNYNDSSLTQEQSEIDIRTNKAYVAYGKILDFLETVNYDAYVKGYHFCYEFTQRDLADLFKNPKDNRVQIKKSKRALHKLCKRIPPRQFYVPINSKDFITWLIYHYLP